MGKPSSTVKGDTLRRSAGSGGWVATVSQHTKTRRAVLRKNKGALFEIEEKCKYAE